MSHNPLISLWSTLRHREIRWSKGEYIVHEEDCLNRIYIVTRGRLQVFRSLSNGKTFIYQIYRPGDVVGDIEFFLQRPAAASVLSTEESYTLSYAMEDIRRNEKLHRQSLELLGRSLAHKLFESSHYSADASSFGAKTRLAAYFLSHRDPGDQAASLRELAPFLGISYRHLGRLIKIFTQKGLVEKHRGRGFRLVDPEALSHLAEK